VASRYECASRAVFAACVPLARESTVRVFSSPERREDTRVQSADAAVLPRRLLIKRTRPIVPAPVPEPVPEPVHVPRRAPASDQIATMNRARPIGLDHVRSRSSTSSAYTRACMRGSAFTGRRRDTEKRGASADNTRRQRVVRGSPSSSPRRLELDHFDDLLVGHHPLRDRVRVEKRAIHDRARRMDMASDARRAHAPSLV